MYENLDSLWPNCVSADEAVLGRGIDLAGWTLYHDIA